MGAAPAVGDSWVSPAITIPSVAVAGTMYTTAYVTSNGLLKLGGAAPGAFLYTSMNTNPDGGGVHLAPFNADLNVAFTNVSSNIRMEEIGQELIFQWKSFKRYGQTEEFDFQIRINRINGEIIYVYNLISGPGIGTSYYPQIGIALSNTNYLAREVASNATSSWANTTVATNNSSTCRFTSTATNPKQFTSGQTYKFAPVPCDPIIVSNTTVANSNICSGSNITFNVSGSLPARGSFVYQLQGSFDNITYVNIVGATSIPAAAPIVYKHYRFRMSCLGANDTVYSNPVLVNYSNEILSSSGGTICGVGSVNLTATANAGTIDWFTAPIGGSVIGSGSPFSSPIINNTTTFYAATRTTANGFATVGNGASTSTTYPNPFYSNWANTHNQYLIPAQELLDAGLVAGNITSIGITVNSGTSTINNVNLKIGSTNATALTAFETSTFTNVIQNATYTPVIGLNTITFATPYLWDGVSNLLIDWCFDNLTSTSTLSNNCVADPTSYISTIHVNRTTTTNVSICGNTTTGLTTYQVRPRFIFGGTKACYSLREPVIATVTPPAAFEVTADATICNNSIKNISVVTGAADFNNITWTPIANLFTDAAATIPYVANAHAPNVYYKSNVGGAFEIVSKAFNTTTLCTNYDTLTLTNLPDTINVLALMGSFCNSGITTLNIVGTNPLGTASFQWQESTNNSVFTNIAGATSSSYITPALTSTKYYRVLLQANANTCSNTVSVSDTVTINNPVVLSTSGNSVCGSDSVLLEATADANYTINWYDAINATTPIATGSSYRTPLLTNSTDYWVTASSGSADTAKIGAGLIITDVRNNYEGTSPFAMHYGNYKHQILVLASELIANGLTAGNINSLGFDVVLAGTSPLNNFSISLIETNLTALTATFVTGGTQVYTGNVTPVVGRNTYAFTTPFAWDGVSNIVVQVCHNNNNSGSNTNSAEVKYDVTPMMSHIINRLDGTQNTICAHTAGNNSNDGPLIDRRPVMYFGGNSRCEGPKQLVRAIINPLPIAQINRTGNVGLCNGSTTIVSSVNVADEYLWFQNGNLIVGSNNANLTISDTGNYYLVTRSTFGCSDTSDVIQVGFAPFPTVTLGSDFSICVGDSATITVQSNATDIIWDDNSVQNTRTISQAGTYVVTVSNNFGCKSSDTIVVGQFVMPTPNLGNDTLICPYDTLELNPGNYTQYFWSTSATTPTILVNASGIYYVNIIDPNGCKGKDSITIGNIPFATSEGFSFVPFFYEQRGKVQFSAINPISVRSYSWDFGDGNTSTQVSPLHTYANEGQYRVRMTLDAGYCTEIVEEQMISLNFNSNAIKGNELQQMLKLYPNPANDNVTLELDAIDIKMQHISIFDAVGRVLLSQVVNNDSQITINTSAFVSGVYTISIQTNNGVIHRKFEILK